MRRQPDLQGKLLAKGGWDYALVDALAPQPGDMVIAKSRYSGFFNTGIDSALRARGIRTLVFTGIATNVCVESSLRDARSEEHTSELQSLMRISYAVFCLKKKKTRNKTD